MNNLLLFFYFLNNSNSSKTMSRFASSSSNSRSISPQQLQDEEQYDNFSRSDRFPFASEVDIQRGFETLIPMYKSHGIHKQHLHLYLPHESMQCPFGTKISLFFDNCPKNRSALRF